MTKYPVKQLAFISKFNCNSKKCIYDCCTRYSTVKIEEEIVELYRKEAPELLNFIKKRDNTYIMVNTDKVCSMFQDNLCHIQCKYGINFLSEICHTYPRLFTKIKNEIFVTSSFPCSEMLKSALFSENPFNWEEVYIERIPNNFKEVNFKAHFDGIEVNRLIDINRAIMEIVNDKDSNTEEILIKLLILGEFMDKVNRSDWPFIINRLLNIVKKTDLRRLYPRADKDMAIYTLDNYIVSLFSITRNYREKDFDELIKSISSYLEKNTINLDNIWKNNICNTFLDNILKNYIKAKISENLFPLSTWGQYCFNDLVFIVIAYVGIRFAFMTNYNIIENESSDIIIKTIINFETALYGKRNEMLRYYKDIGWISMEKMISLLVNSRS